MKCKNCNNKMRENYHKTLTDKMINQPYFFSRWYICDNCKFIQHLERYKIINITTNFLNK